MDWILAPWTTLLAGGWVLAVVVHTAALLPDRSERRPPRA